MNKAKGAYLICPFDLRVSKIMLPEVSVSDLESDEVRYGAYRHLYEQDSSGHMAAIIWALTSCTDSNDSDNARTDASAEIKCVHLSPSNILYFDDNAAIRHGDDVIHLQRNETVPRFAWGLYYEWLFSRSRPSSLPFTIYGRAVVVGKGMRGALEEPSISLEDLQKSVYWSWGLADLVHHKESASKPNPPAIPETIKHLTMQQNEVGERRATSGSSGGPSANSSMEEQ